MYNLAIESSCDETSVAILEDGRKVLVNLISSQIDIHEQFGGVVPEIASRKHLEVINHILDKALADTGLTIEDIDLISVTRGPGLVGALLVGVSAAKALSYVKKIPIVGVNHMEGHICANFIAHKELEPPFLTLIVSGGHSYLLRLGDYASYEVLGSTRDDAAGESFDKVARMLGLPYPGGPAIQKAAESGNPKAIDFPRAMLEEGNFDFSFSGLKTSVSNYLNTAKQAGKEININDVAASFQQAIIDVLVEKVNRSLDLTGMTQFCLSGGVAANKPLQEALRTLCEKRGISFYVPPLELCTDNAAMIGSAGYYHFIKRGPSALDFAADPDLGL